MKAGQIITVDDAQVDALAATGYFENTTNQSRPPNPADVAVIPQVTRQVRPATAARSVPQPRQDENVAKATETSSTR